MGEEIDYSAKELCIIVLNIETIEEWDELGNILSNGYGSQWSFIDRLVFRECVQMKTTYLKHKYCNG